MLYKLQDNILTKAPKSVVIDGTTYINNNDVLRQLGYKELVHDTNTQADCYISNTTYTEDDAHIYEHFEWSKYENVETPHVPTVEERLAEAENNVTELQLAMCDIYENMGGGNNA
jgi:hypothetical protein